jgi:uncharacterized membrane protein YedE/YeeE
MHMTYLPALLGGLLIGLSALLLYAAYGRIAGISGIAFGGILGTSPDREWRWLFLAGLIGGAWLAVALGAAKPLAILPAQVSQSALLVVAGLLVGVGTRMANGCTSGHGVCGLARLSRRSLLSVMLFMGAGIATATVLRPWLAGVP